MCLLDRNVDHYPIAIGYKKVIITHLKFNSRLEKQYSLLKKGRIS